MKTHKQKRIHLKDGTRITCDEGIKEIIRLLNDNGFHTDLSCEDNVKKTIWIEFHSIKIVETLMTKALREDIKYNHPKYERETLWMKLLDWGAEWNICMDEHVDNIPVVHLSPALRFPKSQKEMFYGMLERLLKS